MGVVVALEDRKPIGIMTERDVAEVLYKGVGLEEEISRYIKKNLISANGDRAVCYALNLTMENNIRRVIVVDDLNNFLGVVTQQNLLKYVEEDYFRLTIKVKHILKKRGYILSVSPSATLNNVLKIMVTNKISAVPVIEDSKPVGIISEKDILKLASENISFETSASRYMNGPVQMAGLDSLLVDVVESMNSKNIRRVIIVDDDGEAINIVTIRDVVENLEVDYNRFLLRKLRNAKEILNLLPEMLIEVIDTGKEQLIIWANAKVINKFGREILDKPITSFLPSETWCRIYTSLASSKSIEHVKLKKDERIYDVSGFFITTFGKMEKGIFQLIMRDITDDIRLSTVDPLTDIYNRRFINEFLIKEIERSKRMKTCFSVIISDIDDFKIINDSYGHISGDMVLKLFAKLITGTVRNMDVVGRYGGDEFMLILPTADNEIASRIISRLKIEIESMDIPILKEKKIRVTASFGIASYPEDGVSVDDLLVKADERLYKAKARGKNKIACC